jgi:hypothetical protein
MSNVAAKKETRRPDGFEGLLTYYVKLTPNWSIEQWVILELYNELILDIFSSQVTPLNGDKDHPNFQCVYIVEENGQVSYDFLTMGLKDAKMLPLTQKQINTYVF